MLILNPLDHVPGFAGTDLTGQSRSDRNRAPNVGRAHPDSSRLCVVGSQNGRLPGAVEAHPPGTGSKSKKIGVPNAGNVEIAVFDPTKLNIGGTYVVPDVETTGC